MKATNHSEEQTRDKKSLYRPARSSRAETAVLASLGVVALSTVVIALVSGSVPAKPGDDPLARYIHSGQLGADVRTAKALGQYFFEAEPAIITNVTEAGHTQKNLVVLTNNVDG